MIIAFELSMPSNNSWDGRWTGESNYYAIVKTLRSGWPTVDGKPVEEYNRYSFGDGWAAAVKLREVDSSEARKLRRQSKGFCGYDWMVDSIIKHGRIQP